MLAKHITKFNILINAWMDSSKSPIEACAIFGTFGGNCHWQLSFIFVNYHNH